MEKKFVIGIDYGTDSVRSVVVDTTVMVKLQERRYLNTQDGKRDFIVILLSISSDNIPLIILKVLSNL